MKATLSRRTKELRTKVFNIIPQPSSLVFTTGTMTGVVLTASIVLVVNALVGDIVGTRPTM